MLWDDCTQEDIWEDFKASKQGDGEENLALVSMAKKGSKGNNEWVTSQPRKKDLSKCKCFICHKSGLYALQCSEKKGKEKSHQITTLTEVCLDEFAMKFEDFSFFSYLSTTAITMGAWYLNSGASHHMTNAWWLFSNLTERDSNLHVKLGNDAKYAVTGVATIKFLLESRGTLKPKDVLFIPRLKKNLLSLSIIEMFKALVDMF